MLHINKLNILSDYYREFEDALYSDSGNNYLGKHYSDYIDMNSFAKMYLLQEFSKNVDVGASSSYLVKDVEEKFEVGPIWDMDNTLGAWSNRNGIDCHNPEGYAAAIG